MASNPSAFVITPASIGAAAAGSLTWQPSDNGWLAATGDPALYVNTSVVTAGTVYLVKLSFRSAVLVSNLWLGCTVVGVGASSGSFAGLYSSAGSLLSGSADIGASFLAAGPIACPLTTPQTVAAGSFAWASFVFNLATTQPSLTRGSGVVSVVNANLTAATFRAAVNGTGQVALPGSITPSSNTSAGALPFLVGVS